MYKFLNEEYEILKVPLTKRQINGSPENKVTGVIAVQLSDMIDRDLEDFLDFLEQQLVEEGLAMEINYTLVGCSDKNTVLLLVSAYVDIEPE